MVREPGDRRHPRKDISLGVEMGPRMHGEGQRVGFLHRRHKQLREGISRAEAPDTRTGLHNLPGIDAEGAEPSDQEEGRREQTRSRITSIFQIGTGS